MRILITGGTGMVGSAFGNLETEHELIRYGSDQYDLRDEQQVEDMFYRNQADAVIHLAARVGGVKGNSDYVADFFHDNIMMNSNLLTIAKNYKIPKVLSLLSTCVYPNDVTYPLTEDQIHNGEPHESNFGYAYAKRMLEVHSRALRRQYGCNFITAIPNNIYGPGDNFHLEYGHVIPAIIRKVWEAKHNDRPAVLWATGRALREFTYSDDVVRSLIMLLESYDSAMPINVGKTTEYSIREIAGMVCRIFDYNFDLIEWDDSKPEGQYRKPSSNKEFLKRYPDFEYTEFEIGLRKTCAWFEKAYPNVRGC